MTEKKITSISLEWFNYGEHCVEDKSYSRTTFYRRTRNKNKQTIKEDSHERKMDY